MSIVIDNYKNMSQGENPYSSIGDVESFKIRFNVEFLRGCEFNCSGCYVSRDNNFSEKDLDMVLSIATGFRERGYKFEEVIVGPTDFFAAFNTLELITNKKFIKLFMNKTVMTIITTLQSSKNQIFERIKILNENFGKDLDLEVLILFEVKKILQKDKSYCKSLRERIDWLQKIEGKVEYAMQMNIQDTKQIENFNLENISAFIKEEFNTIAEFNPSFLRSLNSESSFQTLQSWNQMLKKNIKKNMVNKESDILFTMANPNHSGFNDITYNIHQGYFYSCPFIYENVFDKSAQFKIMPSGLNGKYLISDFINHRYNSELEQINYIDQTEECGECPHVMSCIGKQVLFYMKSKNIKKCLLAKEVMEIYVNGS